MPITHFGTSCLLLPQELHHLRLPGLLDREVDRADREPVHLPVVPAQLRHLLRHVQAVQGDVQGALHAEGGRERRAGRKRHRWVNQGGREGREGERDIYIYIYGLMGHFQVFGLIEVRQGPFH